MWLRYLERAHRDDLNDSLNVKNLPVDHEIRRHCKYHTTVNLRKVTVRKPTKNYINIFWLSVPEGLKLYISYVIQHAESNGIVHFYLIPTDHKKHLGGYWKRALYTPAHTITFGEQRRESKKTCLVLPSSKSPRFCLKLIRNSYLNRCT